MKHFLTLPSRAGRLSAFVFLSENSHLQGYTSTALHHQPHLTSKSCASPRHGTGNREYRTPTRTQPRPRLGLSVSASVSVSDSVSRLRLRLTQTQTQTQRPTTDTGHGPWHMTENTKHKTQNGNGKWKTENGKRKTGRTAMSLTDALVI